MNLTYRRIAVGVVLLILSVSKLPFLASVLLAIVLTPTLEALLDKPTQK